jgi:hypothetical protein
MRRRRSKPGVSALAVGELKRHLVEQVGTAWCEVVVADGRV